MRHRFVDGKFVKTQQIFQVTEKGVSGLLTMGMKGSLIWRDRYLLSYMDLDILDLWTGQHIFLGREAPPPYHTFTVISMSPEELIVANVHTTARTMTSAIADMKLYRMRDPNGKLEPLQKEETPFWPVLPSISALHDYWEVSPDGNRRVMHPLDGGKPAPEDGLWLYDAKTREKKFLAGSFYKTEYGGGTCMVWLDNERFLTYRPDGEIVLVQWDGTVTSIGVPPGMTKGTKLSNDAYLFLNLDGQGRIFCNGIGNNMSMVDVDARAFSIYIDA